MKEGEGKNPYDLSDAELYSLYNSGPDITISFIKLLLDRLKGIEAMVKRQGEEIAHLKSIISKDSHNSSKPPSTDGYKKKSTIKNLRKKSKKKSGGQKGHPGTNLRMSDNPDIIKPLRVERCSCCGEKKHLKIIGQKRRQVVDVEIKRRVIEYQADIAECSGCCNITTAAFPVAVNQDVQYGELVKALIIYMRNLNFMPTGRLTEMFADVFHIPLSEGTIYNTNKKCSDILKPFEDYVKGKLLKSPVVHFDETGIRVEKILHWLHCASNELYTYYFPHKRRGRIAMDAMGILPFFNGTAIHDSLPSYFKYACKHGLCNAHHLRELIFLNEEMGQRWAKKMIVLLLELKEKVDKAKAKGKTINKKLMLYYENRYKRIIYEGLLENPTGPPITVQQKKRGRKKKGKVLCLLDRFKTRLYQVIAFMYDILVPFDNNQVERDIRMGKLYQKISGCFRTMAGANDFFLIRSYISTLRKHKIDVISSLKRIFETGQFCDIMAE